jgi:hypothetical protein
VSPALDASTAAWTAASEQSVAVLVAAETAKAESRKQRIGTVNFIEIGNLR